MLYECSYCLVHDICFLDSKKREHFAKAFPFPMPVCLVLTLVDSLLRTYTCARAAIHAEVWVD